jgi:hypothetical protein
MTLLGIRDVAMWEERIEEDRDVTRHPRRRVSWSGVFEDPLKNGYWMSIGVRSSALEKCRNRVVDLRVSMA